MKQVHAEIDIDAPAARVWDLLTDFAAFPQWNPFIREARGDLRPGGRLLVRLRLFDRLITCRPTVLAIEPHRELRWLAHTGLPGLFDIARSIRIEPRTDGGVRLVQHEDCSGVLAPLLFAGGILERQIHLGYVRLNDALKARAEAPAVSPPPLVLAQSRGGRRRAALALVAAAVAIPFARRARRVTPSAPYTSATAWRAHISNHSAFNHDELASLGYDWSRVANPDIAPRPPLRIYLPRTTEEVACVVREARDRGERLVVRSKGHSSNDLALADRGSLLLTQDLQGDITFDDANLTVMAGAGTPSAIVDDWLAARGYGLPVIGSHIDITLGGFAAVGGVSPASHRFGLFVDTVVALEYVNWDGTVITCGRTERSDDFYRVLTGTGQYGVITRMTVRVIRVDKYGTILRNDCAAYRTFADFVAGSEQQLNEPGGALYARGIWLDASRSGRALARGQFSSYHEASADSGRQWRNEVAYGFYHGLGRVGPRLPSGAHNLLKYAGTAAVLFPPAYASIKHIEMDTDKTLDATIGDPTRWLVLLVPLAHYATIVQRVHDLLTEFRTRHGCFTFFALYVKGIRSPYLAQGGSDERFCELIAHLGVVPHRLPDAVLDNLVSQLDDLCIAQGAFRYMHTRTVKDPERRRRIDPNAYYARSEPGPAVGSMEGAISSPVAGAGGQTME